MSSDRQIAIGETEINPILGDATGIYIYDLATNERKLIIPEGRFGIPSPVNAEIGFIKDQSISVMDLKDSSVKSVYKVGLKDKIVNLHWTPDGKFIYIAYYIYSDFSKLEPEEKLIEIKTNKEAPFIKIGQGFKSYTWK